MSNLWLFTAFVPFILLQYHDLRNAPHAEIENFYRYALEVKKTKGFYDNLKDKINTELVKLDENSLETIKNDLNSHDKTLFEVVRCLDRVYLAEAAIKE